MWCLRPRVSVQGEEVEGRRVSHAGRNAGCWGAAWARAGWEPPGVAIALAVLVERGTWGREWVGNWWGWFLPAEVCTDLGEGWGHSGSVPDQWVGVAAAQPWKKARGWGDLQLQPRDQEAFPAVAALWSWMVLGPWHSWCCVCVVWCSSPAGRSVLSSAVPGCRCQSVLSDTTLNHLIWHWHAKLTKLLCFNDTMCH